MNTTDLALAELLLTAEEITGKEKEEHFSRIKKCQKKQGYENCDQCPGGGISAWDVRCPTLPEWVTKISSACISVRTQASAS